MSHYSGSRTAERTAGQTPSGKFAAKVQQQLESSDLDQYRALLSKIQPTAEGEEQDLELWLRHC